jgi:serine protease AprX
MIMVTGLKAVRNRAMVGLVVVLALLATAMPALAQHRARLSNDLAQWLQVPDRPTHDIIFEGDAAVIRDVAARHGLRIKKTLATGAVLEGSAAQIDAAASDPLVAQLSGDAEVRAHMAVTRATIGAEAAWAGFANVRGVNGHDINVALIDSGVGQHATLRNRIVAAFDFTGGHSATTDEFGHGTHLANIIAGDGERTGGTVDYSGVAPGARIVSLKVLDDHGIGQTSDVIRAIDWVVDNHDRYRLRIINLSLGHPVFESWREDPLCRAVNRAVRAGLIVVTSAGNYGKLDDGTRIIGGMAARPTRRRPSPWAR